MQTYAIKTFGCSMNISDSERVSAVLESRGLYEIEDILSADVVVFNTCSIKQKAEDKVFSLVNNVKKAMKRTQRDGKVLLTGCMVKTTSSQASEERDQLLQRIPEIDVVFRIEDTPKLPSLLGVGDERDESSYLQIVPKYKNSFQAIVPIQTGCDNFCTFCVVPYTRGREQSRPMEHICKEISILAKMGVKEVILTGQNVNSYGKGLPETKRTFNEEHSKWMEGTEKTPFTLLLEQVAAIDGIERIRFQSSNPHDMTKDVVDIICSEPKIMPALHFALQSGDDAVLARMNRKHTIAEFIAIVEDIRKKRPDFAISTDIIVGFSGEDEKAFEATMKAIESIAPDMIFISKYSLRPGTAAYKVFEDDVPDSVKTERFHTLNDWLRSHTASKLSTLIGNVYTVLLEREHMGYLEGKTEHNRVCRVPVSSQYAVGDIIPVRITGSSNWSMEGEYVSASQ